MQRRSRVLHALAQMRLREPPEDPAEIATITSETLSAHTPFASPRHSPSPARIIIRSPEPASPARTELPAPSPRMLVPGDTAPTQVDDATPGHTPPRSPVPQVSPPALLRWHETRPPTSNPGERCSWLYVPLLHAAAGFLSESAYAAWSGEPEIGERWLAMVVALRNAPPSLPQVLANAMHTVAELEARHAEEQAVADLLALPPHPLPLPTAVALCQSQDGYLTAATQAALLEVFGGSVVAAAALALAEDVRAIHGRRAQPPPIPSRQRGCRGRGRGRGGRAVAEHRATGASDDDACPGLAATTGVPASAWEALDAIDLQVELRRPVPTLQDVPPFLRAVVKTALLTALTGLREACEQHACQSGVTESRAWKLFLLTLRMLLARPDRQGAQGRDELISRARAFQRGDWVPLLDATHHKVNHARGAAAQDAETVAERRRAQACAKVRLGELSRARHILTAAELAPGSEATWRAPSQPRTPIPRPLGVAGGI